MNHLKNWVIIGWLASFGSAWAETPSDASVRAFENTVYSVLRRAGTCVTCHGDPFSLSPLHSQDDVEKAYGISKGYVNASIPEKSPFVTRMSDNHCGNPSICKVDNSVMVKAVKAWIAQDAEGFPDSVAGLIKTEEQPFPQDLSADRFQTIRFSLDHLAIDGGLQVDGGFIEIEVKLFKDEGLQIRKPRVAVKDLPVRVEDLRVIINGKEFSNSRTFSNIRQNVLPESFDPNSALWPHPILSGRVLLTTDYLASSLKTAKIQLGFVKFEQGESFGCPNVEGFKKYILPIYRVRACFDCHGGGDEQLEGVPAAVARMSYKGSIEDQCLKSYQRITRSDFNWSPLLVMPLGGTGKLDHVGVLANSDGFYGALKHWLGMEE